MIILFKLIFIIVKTGLSDQVDSDGIIQLLIEIFQKIHDFNQAIDEKISLEYIKSFTELISKFKELLLLDIFHKLVEENKCKWIVKLGNDQIKEIDIKTIAEIIIKPRFSNINECRFLKDIFKSLLIYHVLVKQRFIHKYFDEYYTSFEPKFKNISDEFIGIIEINQIKNDQELIREFDIIFNLISRWVSTKLSKINELKFKYSSKNYFTL